MVRVLVDATALPTNRGGVGRYLDGLLGALAGSAGSGAQVVVASKPADRAGYEALGLGSSPASRARPSSGSAGLGTDRLALRVARRVRPDVLHSPHYTQPVFGRLPTVVTVHDATFFTDPQLHSVVKARFFRAATRWVSSSGLTGLIVPSEATRQELARHAHVAVGRGHRGAARRRSRRLPSARRGGRGAIAADSSIWATRSSLLSSARSKRAQNVSALVRGWALAVRDLPHPPALVVAGGPRMGRHGRRRCRWHPEPASGHPTWLPADGGPARIARWRRGRRVSQLG